MAKNLFDSSIEEEKKKKEQDPRITVALNYKDKRNEPAGVLIISALSFLFAGSITGIFLLIDAFSNIAMLVIFIILVIFLLGLIIYSIYFYFKNKNMPEEALFYDEKNKIFDVYNHKTSSYDSYKAEQIKKIMYKDHSLYPTPSIFGPVPKKPLGDKITIILKDDTKISLFILDVFKTKKILSEIKVL